MVIRDNPITYKRLDAVIIDLELDAKGEDILRQLPRRPIEYQNIIAILTGAIGDTARTIHESTNKHLPALIPTFYRILMRNLQRCIKCNKCTIPGLWIVEHDAQCRSTKMTDIEHHVCAPTRLR